MKQHLPSWRAALDIAASLVLIGAAGVVMYSTFWKSSGNRAEAIAIPSEPISVADAATRGSETATVAMVIYSDFECPFCRRFVQETLPDIEQRYVTSGKVLVAYKHFPLSIHKNAVQAAASSECAHEQGRFWDMHDSLFAETNLEAQRIRSIVESLPLDMQVFDQCMSNVKHAGRLQATIDDAKRAGIKATPTFYFGERLDDGRVRVTRAFSGARPLTDFVTNLDEVLEGGTGDSKWWSRLLAN